MITLDWTECRPPILLAVYFLSFAPLLVRGRHSQLPARLGERRSLGERGNQRRETLETEARGKGPMKRPPGPQIYPTSYLWFCNVSTKLWYFIEMSYVGCTVDKYQEQKRNAHKLSQKNCNPLWTGRASVTPPPPPSLRRVKEISLTKIMP